MAHTQRIKFGDFMSGDYKRQPRDSHFRKHAFKYQVAGTTAILLATGVDVSFAASTIDAGASALYYELTGVGKWVIIFKGGFDTVKSVGAGDFDGAKKHFFSYLLVYLMLLGLPYGLDKVDQVFRDMKSI
jgi:hypothetical protein